MDKTGDVRCPKCNSNNCSIKNKKGLYLECVCVICGTEFNVPDTDGIPISNSE